MAKVRAYKSEKRKKELLRKKKQEEKRQKRQKKPTVPLEEFKETVVSDNSLTKGSDLPE